MPAQPIESLLSRLEPQLRRLASRSTSLEVSQSADDLLSDLSLKLTAHPPLAESNAESYAVESFKNLIKDRQRTCNRRRARDVEFMRTRPEIGSDRVETRAIRHDLRWHIKRAARHAKLRPDHRCALWAWLRDSLDDFATRRGIPHKTARVWAWRAREALRPHLEHMRRDFSESPSLGLCQI